MDWLKTDEGQAKLAKVRAKRIKQKNEESRKFYVQRKKNYHANNKKTRKRAVKEACHDYIRERDKDCVCICCGKPLGDDFHAGHCFESGSNSRIRYDENNIHAQRLDCNVFHGGDSGEYKDRVIAKIGLFEYHCLKSKKGGIDTRTTQDLKEIEVYFKNKLKELKEGGAT